MLRAIAHLVRRPFSFLSLLRPQRVRQIRRSPSATRLWLETLEDRTLPSGFPLQQVLSVLSNGANTLSQDGAAIINASQGLGLDIPMTAKTISAELGLPSDIQTPFSTLYNQLQSLPANAIWKDVAQQLASSFTAVNAVADASGQNLNLFSDGKTLLTATWNVATPWSDNGLSAAANGGENLSYQSLSLGLSGSVQASATVTVNVTAGVALQGGQLVFFINAPNALQVSNLTLANPSGLTLSGNLHVSNILPSVSATATLTNASISASVGFSSTLYVDGSTTSGQIAAAVSGNITSGSLALNAGFKAQITLLTAPETIAWTATGNYTYDTSHSKWTSGVSLNIDPAFVSQMLSDLLLSQTSALANDIPVLSPAERFLSQPLPVLGESIAQLLGVEKYLPDLSALTSLSLSDLNVTDYPVAGGFLTTHFTTQSITAFLFGNQGQAAQDLVDWTTIDSCANNAPFLRVAHLNSYEQTYRIS